MESARGASLVTVENARAYGGKVVKSGTVSLRGVTFPVSRGQTKCQFIRTPYIFPLRDRWRCFDLRRSELGGGSDGFSLR